MTHGMIILEFNELCTNLIHRFIAEDKLPNFKHLHDQSEVFTTFAEEDAPYLEPWIQWVNVHSGLTYAQHGIFNLGDGYRLNRKCIWDVVSELGQPVWVCGSMNIRYDCSINGYVLPDPWITNVPPFPDELTPYFRFVQRNVLEHTNDEVSSSKAELARFARFMLSHGLSWDTVVATVRQLFSEAVGGLRWKRAFILDQLQFDLFLNIYLRTRPRFSTFFLNSTAHMQHMYWRNMEPSLFRHQPTEREQIEFDLAIELGYRKMDKLLGKFVQLARRDRIILVFMTALSQQPCLTYEEQGGKVLYRPRRFEDLLRFVGARSPYRVAPAMAEEFHVYFDAEIDAIEAAEKLANTKVDIEPAIKVRRQGRDVFAGCRIFRAIDMAAELHLPSGEKSRFGDLFYRIEGVKSGMHHRDGLMWICNGRPHRVCSEKVPLAAVAPTLLDMMGLVPPKHMIANTVLTSRGSVFASSAGS